MAMAQAQTEGIVTTPACGDNDIVSLHSISRKNRSRQSRRLQSMARNHGTFVLLVILLGLVAVPFINGPNRFLVQAEDADNYYAAADDAADDALDDAVANDDGDDDYIDLSGADFEKVSLMPVSCVNYMNGQMIKFELFESSSNFQCHTRNLGVFVVSISHYMRAYFNYQALIQGQDFKLPNDAGYLNCVQLQATSYSEQKLYAKIGCMERETYTSTKLKIHVYTDKQCTERYDDGQSEDKRNRKGYDINGYFFSSKVSFRPPFYSCLTCKPNEISETFSKQGTYWYDDDAVANGMGRSKYDDVVDDAVMDDYFSHDDTYYRIQQYVGNQVQNKKEDDDDFYTEDDDSGRHMRGLKALVSFTPVKEAFDAFSNEFWSDHNRQLEDAADDDGVSNWNMCQRVYKYGVWCDNECQDLDKFRVDEWSTSDIFLLVIMCLFMGSMMLLVFAKRVKAYEKASVYGDELNVQYPGLPPLAMCLLFIGIMSTIIILANLRLVNQTLVFAVVTCILLFIYMLKLTLFETSSSGITGGKRIAYDNFDGKGFFG